MFLEYHLSGMLKGKKNGKPNSIKSFWSYKTKGPEQDSQNEEVMVLYQSLSPLPPLPHHWWTHERYSSWRISHAYIFYLCLQPSLADEISMYIQLT